MAREIREQDVRVTVEMDMLALTLLERLEIERQRAGFTHRSFAGHLGMSPTIWRDLRTGRGEFSANHYIAIIAKFPALAGYVYRHQAYRALTEDPPDGQTETA